MVPPCKKKKYGAENIFNLIIFKPVMYDPFLAEDVSERLVLFKFDILVQTKNVFTPF